MTQPTSVLRLVLMTALATAFVWACGDPGPTVTAVSVSQGKGGGGPNGDPTVKSAVPDSALQETTLDVEIGGSGFDEGTVVEFAIDEVPSDGITVNSTEFVSSRKLRSNITVAADADTVLYDITVLTAKGRPGIGTELFEVKPKGDTEVRVTFRDASLDGYRSDGLGSYEGTSGSVSAVVQPDGKFVFGAGQGRQVRIDVTANGGSIFSEQVDNIAATTKPYVQNLWDVPLGATLDVPFRVQFAHADTMYFLRFGRDCAVDTLVTPNEQARVTRTATGWILENEPSRSARLCKQWGKGKKRRETAEVHDVLAPFRLTIEEMSN